MEALDAAIDYKNYHIESHQREIRQSMVLNVRGEERERGSE